MSKIVRAIAAVAGAMTLAGCAAAAPTGSPRSMAQSLSVEAEPVAHDAMTFPADCAQLIGPDITGELTSRSLIEGPTGDTIQGRFSGIGNGARSANAMSCAYSATDGRDDRVEFGVERLSIDDRALLLDVLRSGPGRQTAGLVEFERDDVVVFTQFGAAASGVDPGRWSVVFTVYPDAWTMVWSPSGGEGTLAEHSGWSRQLEAQLYP